MVLEDAGGVVALVCSEGLDQAPGIEEDQTKRRLPSASRTALHPAALLLREAVRLRLRYEGIVCRLDLFRGRPALHPRPWCHL